MQKSLKTITLLSLVMFIATISTTVNAQETTAHSTIIVFIQRGGPVMYVLLTLSFISMCLVFFYLMSLRSGTIVPPDFISQIDSALEEGDYEMANGICKDNDSAAARIIEAGTELYIKSNNNYLMIRNAVEDEGARQASKLWHKIQPLQDIAVIAPMVGLLGTVIGMINSFMSLTAEVGTPRPTVIASGVSMALITTAAGLIIGITAMILYSYFRSRINSLLSILEHSCNKITVKMMISNDNSEIPF